jgi:hypothetical protein
MLVEVWYKNEDELVELNEDLVEEMQNKIDTEYTATWANYILSCEWVEGHLRFYADGPWEC